MAGAAGFILSFLAALISGAGFPALILRPLFFGAVFFALAGGIWALVNKFFPELLDISPEEDESPGSRVDITVEDGQPVPFAGALPSQDSGEEPDDISGILNYQGTAKARRDNAVDLDQKGKDGYTDNGGGVSRDPENAGNMESPGSLPDLDAMAGAFSSGSDASLNSAETVPDAFSGGGAGDAGVYEAGTEIPAPVERRKTSGKGQSMGGDFNPKDLASAIQTILSKE
jgi:hypothetical protein